MVYKIIFDENALIDIDNAIEYYESISEQVKIKFYNSLQISINRLKKSPHFQVRYSDFRCLPLKKFPFMIQFKVFEETKNVLILGVINTYRNPETSYLK